MLQAKVKGHGFECRPFQLPVGKSCAQEFFHPSSPRVNLDRICQVISTNCSRPYCRIARKLTRLACSLLEVLNVVHVSPCLKMFECEGLNVGTCWVGRFRSIPQHSGTWRDPVASICSLSSAHSICIASSTQQTRFFFQLRLAVAESLYIPTHTQLYCIVFIIYIYLHYLLRYTVQYMIWINMTYSCTTSYSWTVDWRNHANTCQALKRPFEGMFGGAIQRDIFEDQLQLLWAWQAQMLDVWTRVWRHNDSHARSHTASWAWFKLGVLEQTFDSIWFDASRPCCKMDRMTLINGIS